MLDKQCQSGCELTALTYPPLSEGTQLMPVDWQALVLP